jgi:hypothetical protein
VKRRRAGALKRRYGRAKWRGYESRAFAASWPIEDLASAIDALAKSGAFSVQDLAGYRRGASRRTMDPWTAQRSIDAMLARGFLKAGKGKSKNLFTPTAKGRVWIEAAKNVEPVVRRFWER